MATAWVRGSRRPYRLFGDSIAALAGSEGFAEPHEAYSKVRWARAVHCHFCFKPLGVPVRQSVLLLGWMPGLFV